MEFDMVLTANQKRFLVYGLLIAAAEEFLTQGWLHNAYIVWIFTLIPFAMFLIMAMWLRAFFHRRAGGWIAPLFYYVSMGTLGLAVEWFIIGLTPWRDMTSPLLLIILFHSGMFSFWGTVALGPHVLLDDRVETATVRRAFTGTLVALLFHHIWESSQTSTSEYGPITLGRVSTTRSLSVHASNPVCRPV